MLTWLIVSMLTTASPQRGFAPAPSPAAAGIAAPESWWATALRAETARMVAADLPEEPQTFRFQCSLPWEAKKPWRLVPPACVSIAGKPIADAEAFQHRVEAEAARAPATPQDRLREIARQRVAELYLTTLEYRKKPGSFIVEERLSREDIGAVVPEGPLVSAADIRFDVRPKVDYPAVAKRADMRGRVVLRCISVAQRPECVLAEPLAATGVVYLSLVRAALRAMRAARIAAKTPDGRPTEGMIFAVPINFVLTDSAASAP